MCIFNSATRSWKFILLLAVENYTRILDHSETGLYLSPVSSFHLQVGTWEPQLPWDLPLEALSPRSRFHLSLILEYISVNPCSLGHHHTLQSGVPEILAHGSYVTRPKDPSPTGGEAWEGHRSGGGRDPHPVSENKYKSIKGFHGGVWRLPLANGHPCNSLFLMPEFSSFGIKALFHVKLRTLFTHHIKLLCIIISV